MKYYSKKLLIEKIKQKDSFPLSSKVNPKYLNDYQVMLEFCILDAKYSQYLGDDLKKDKVFWKKLLEVSSDSAVYAEPEILADKDLMILAIKGNPDLYRYLGDDLKKDKEMALLVVSLKGICIKYLIDDFKKDIEIIETALKSDGLAINSLEKHFINNREIILLGSKNIKSEDVACYLFYMSTSVLNDPSFIIEVLDNLNVNDEYLNQWGHNIFLYYFLKNVVKVNSCFNNSIQLNEEDKKDSTGLYKRVRAYLENSIMNNLMDNSNGVNIKKKGLKF
jgi:hypothetical protein